MYNTTREKETAHAELAHTQERNTILSTFITQLRLRAGGEGQLL